MSFLYWQHIPSSHQCVLIIIYELGEIVKGIFAEIQINQ